MSDSLPQSLAVLANTSLGASFNGPSLNISGMLGFCIQLDLTSVSSPVGTFTLQASLDALTWADITDSPQAVSSANICYMWNTAEMCFYNYVRLVYARTSGSAVVNGKLQSKLIT